MRKYRALNELSGLSPRAHLPGQHRRIRVRMVMNGERLVEMLGRRIFARLSRQDARYGKGGESAGGPFRLVGSPAIFAIRLVLGHDVDFRRLAHLSHITGHDWRFGREPPLRRRVAGAGGRGPLR